MDSPGEKPSGFSPLPFLGPAASSFGRIVLYRTINILRYRSDGRHEGHPQGQGHKDGRGKHAQDQRENSHDGGGTHFQLADRRGSDHTRNRPSGQQNRSTPNTEQLVVDCTTFLLLSRSRCTPRSERPRLRRFPLAAAFYKAILLVRVTFLFLLLS